MSQAGTADAGESSSGATEGGGAGTHGGGEGQGGGTGGRFRAVVGAYAVSGYGNYLNLIALSLFSFQVTGSAFGVGALMALRLFAGFLAGLGSAALAARTTRLRIMVGADISQGVAMTVLALCADRTPVWLLGCAVVVTGAGNICFTVALRSAVPAMVGPEARTRANGLLVTGRSIATVLGFASAAPVIAFGVRGRVRVERGEFRGLRRGPAGPAAAHGRRGPGAGGTRPGGGRRAPWAPSAVAGRGRTSRAAARDDPAPGVDALASSSHNVALPVVAHAAEPSAPALFMTRFWVAWAVGTIAAHLVLKRAGKGRAWGERAFAWGTLAMSVCFVAAFTGLPAAGLVAVAACAGFADGWTEIVYTSRLQAAPDRQRSRLFGMSATAETAGFAVGTVLAAAALEALPALSVVGVFHGTAVLAALFLLAFAVTTARSPSRTHGSEGDTHGTRPGTGTPPGA